jgi:hypothetical protein
LIPAVASPEAQADAHACLLDALKVEHVVAIGGSAGAPSITRTVLGSDVALPDESQQNSGIPRPSYLP